MSIIWSGGSCAPCSQADPDGYDPLMGFFNLNRAGQWGDYNYDWHRTGVPNEPHTLGTVTVTSFLFWLHRNKGCGDFEMTATPQITDATVIAAPFSVPCSEALSQDTFLFYFSPGPGTIRGPDVCAPSCTPVFYSSGRGDISITVKNLTATGVQGQLMVGSGSAEPEKVYIPIASKAWGGGW